MFENLAKKVKEMKIRNLTPEKNVCRYSLSYK